jgi:hypothetical protein
LIFERKLREYLLASLSSNGSKPDGLLWRFLESVYMPRITEPLLRSKRNLEYWSGQRAFIESGQWIGTVDGTVSVSKLGLRHCFVRGWIFDPRSTIQNLKITIPALASPFQITGLERADLREAFPLFPHAGRSGFLALLPNAPAAGTRLAVKFEGLDGDGSAVEGSFDDVIVTLWNHKNQPGSHCTV